MQSQKKYIPLISILFIFGLIFFACAKKNTSVAVDKIITSTEEVRFPGTRVFANLPPGYIWDSEKMIYRFGTSEKSTILCQYFPVNFAEMKKEWRREAAGLPDFSMRSYQRGNYEVMTMQGYYSKDKQQQYVLMMETGDHPVVFMGRTDDTTLIAAMNVPGIMESLRYDDDYDQYLFELADFKFDENISGFKYYFSVDNKSRFYYFRHPIKNMEELEPERITVSSRDTMTESEIEKYLKNVGERFLTVSNKKDTLIDDLKTTYVEAVNDDEEQRFYRLIAVIRAPEKTYLFRASANQNLEEMKEKYLATLRSFELK